jgi:hypothetical protein
LQYIKPEDKFLIFTMRRNNAGMCRENAIHGILHHGTSQKCLTLLDQYDTVGNAMEDLSVQALPGTGSYSDAGSKLATAAV